MEQLKNIVQSLSHASVHDEAQEWGDKKKLSRMISTNQGKVDLDPLLRGVPGVDPSVLLQLHRTPWADGVIDGIREEVACFEWQGRDRYGTRVPAVGGLFAGCALAIDCSFFLSPLLPKDLARSM